MPSNLEGLHSNLRVYNIVVFWRAVYSQASDHRQSGEEGTKRPSTDREQKTHSGSAKARRCCIYTLEDTTCLGLA